MKLPVPLRSRCIAVQQMDHISASKRGEVLLMRKMGIILATTVPMLASRQTFEALFSGDLSAEDSEALDHLFPTTSVHGIRGP